MSKHLNDCSDEVEVVTRKKARELGLKFYFTGVACKNGHYSKRRASTCGCVECAENYSIENKDKLAARSKEWRKENKSDHREYFKEYNKNNKSSISERSKIWDDENKERRLGNQKKYREENRGLITEKRKCHYKENKSVYAGYQREYRKKNPLQVFTRRTLNRIEKAAGSDRIKRTELELNYTQKQFKDHIESLWLDGMSWNNRSEWHIDHIKPLSLFIKEGETDPSVINALLNLQPLWATDNLQKGCEHTVAAKQLSNLSKPTNQ